jgi:hypothetical protein
MTKTKPKKKPTKTTRGKASVRRCRDTKKGQFIARYRETGNIAGSAKDIEVDRGTIYDWEEKDPDFALAMKVALDEYVSKLETEADRRAVDGFDEPVYQNGHLVGHKRRFSDVLLMFRLNGLAPEKYKRISRTETTGKDGGPVVSVSVSASDLTDDQLAAIAAGKVDDK